MSVPQYCYVTQGFREDCVNLIARFERLETVRFDGFVEIWKDMKFPLVFAGRKSLIELLEFCEDALIIAKEFFLPPLSFKERIGGLYLLYALYFKKPVNGPKIRVKIEDWQEILEFQAEIGQAEHHDASYIFATLMSNNAFDHCLLDRELGLERSYRQKVPKLRNTYSVLADIRELAGPHDLFERITHLSKHYAQQKRTEMISSRNDESDSREALKLYDEDFGEKLLGRVKGLENSRKYPNTGHPSKMVTRSSAQTNCDDRDASKDGETRNKSRGPGDPIMFRLGRGFNMNSSEESEDEEPQREISNTCELPDVFEEESSSSE